jgi:hypothetical protein
MSAKALLVWMQTKHPTMPNLVSERQNLMNAIAYILSLKERGPGLGLPEAGAPPEWRSHE